MKEIDDCCPLPTAVLESVQRIHVLQVWTMVHLQSHITSAPDMGQRAANRLQAVTTRRHPAFALAGPRICGDWVMDLW